MAPCGSERLPAHRCPLVGTGVGRAAASGLAPPRSMQLRRDDTGRWSVGAAGDTFTLADLKGLHYLRYLIQRPGIDVAALALSDAVSDHPGITLEQSNLGAALDATARSSYRSRLSELDDQLEAADRVGDQSTAERLATERDALVDQLRTATGLGGRNRSRGRVD